ncbi:MAG TPA: GDP-mannose 4,6-dehydratase [Acidimicrobiales bacterium]|nr:GDP-mannose 4,6-dehydratase [Acidimicrobiales bacterium]
MRAYVTGGSGFVGTWLRAHLAEAGDEVVATGAEVDVTDPGAVARAMADARPDAVYHLAGLAHVGRSWQEPAEYFRVNAGGTLHVLEAARRCPGPPRVVVVSSAEVYGSVGPDQLPVGEGEPLRPVSPYAAAKAAAELVAVQAHLGHGLAVVRARPFNHTGPGQAASFVVPAFARRIVAAQRDGTGALRVGNLSAARDLLDVRDVARAYRLLAVGGQAGEAYNVCSGGAVVIGDLVRRMLELAGADLELVEDPELLRPVDVPVLRGDPSRLRAATGWRPEVPLDATLRAVLDQARADLEAAPS